MSRKYDTTTLHRALLDSLSPYVEEHSDMGEKPLLIKMSAPYNMRLKVYLYNCTNPPGARQAGECKSQIIVPGQQRGERGKIVEEPGVITLLMGLASITDDIEDGVFVIWELKKHMEFAYSANVQVSLKAILRAYSDQLFSMKKRGNGEWIVVSRPNRLLEAIQRRVDLDIELLLGEQICY